MLDALKRLLADLEEHIDLEHARRVEALHLATITYQPVPHLPLAVDYPLEEVPFARFPYGEAYADPEKMLFNELLWSFGSIYQSVRLKDDFPLHIRANYGLGIIASLFGAECRILNDSMPWVEPLPGRRAIEGIVAEGPPSFDGGLGRRVVEAYQFFRETLSAYPRCAQAIRLSQPDLQGPFDIAHLLIGAEIFYWVYDQPTLLHALLDLITETYIAFRRHLEPLFNDHAGEDAVYVHGGIFGGKVLIKDDTAAINLSPALYDAFSKPYNERILAAFGGGSLHYCGRARPWHSASLPSPWLRGLNFGNPELQDFPALYHTWSAHRVALVWWGCGQGPEILEPVYAAGISTGISLTARARNQAEAQAILRRHRERAPASIL